MTSLIAKLRHGLTTYALVSPPPLPPRPLADVAVAMLALLALLLQAMYRRRRAAANWLSLTVSMPPPNAVAVLMRPKLKSRASEAGSPRYHDAATPPSSPASSPPPSPPPPPPPALSAFRPGFGEVSSASAQSSTTLRLCRAANARIGAMSIRPPKT